MPSSNRKGKRSKRGNARASRQVSYSAQMVNELRMIRRDQDTQAMSSIPAVPDVQEMVVNRKKVTTLDYTSQILTINVSTTTIQYGTINFSLSQCPNYTSVVATWDFYKIPQVTVTFVPNMANTAVVNPFIVTAIDYNDSGAPTSIDQVNQKETAQTSMFGSMFKRVLNPATQDPVYQGGATFAYAMSSRRKWVNTANAGVPYYGLKYALQTGSMAGLAYTVNVRFVIQAKNQK